MNLANDSGGRVIDGPAEDREFGAAGIAVGDFDGDGNRDVAISAPGAAQNRGEVYCVFGGLDGVPASVDLAASASHLTVVGPTSGTRLGVAMAAADLDGDGADELIVSSAGYSSQYGRLSSGGALVFRGGASLRAAVSIDLRVQRATTCLFASDEPTPIGAALGAGDFNGDGYGDVAVGAPASLGLGAQDRAGKTYVYFGVPHLPEGAPIDVATSALASVVGGFAAGDQLGTDVETGDLTADARDELILGTPNRNGTRNGRQEKSGEVFVVDGRSLGPGARIDLSAGPPMLRLLARDFGDYLGRGLGVGDFNGDRVNDLVAGLIDGDGPLNRREPDCGEVYVIATDLDRPSGTILDAIDDPYWQQVIGDVPERFLGGSLAVADFDGDRLAEIVTASPKSATVNGAQAGILFRIQAREGTHDLLSLPADTLFLGAGTNHVLGTRLLARDATGDGLADVVASAPGAAGKRGRLYIFPGVRSEPNSQPAILHPGTIAVRPGEASTIAVEATDADGDPVRFSIAGRPDWVSFRDNANGSVTLTVTPPNGVTGLFEFPLRVSDGISRAAGVISIRVEDAVAPVVLKAKFANNSLKITGEGFTSDAEVFVNGTRVGLPVAFKASKNRLVVRGSRQQLGLNEASGANQVVVAVAGAASQAFVF